MGRRMLSMSAKARALLRLAGYLTWILAGLPMFVNLIRAPQLLSDERHWLWLGCFFTFGITFGFTRWTVWPERPRLRQLAALALQTLTALVMILLVCSGHEGSLLVIVAAQLGWLLPLRQAMTWMSIQAVLMGVVLAFRNSAGVTLALMSAYVGSQILALFGCFLAASEASLRSDLTNANSELRATGELLANTSRLAERERISRELHDTLGHHLTALSLNLEAARHLVRDDALVQIQRAQAVTKLLLGDVRGVVTTLRGEDPIGLVHALKTLVEGVPTPQIHLMVPEDLTVSDPVYAHTLLRCVQEIVTNTIRHAAATNLWIELSSTDSGIVIHARDDGRGAKQVLPGHGLIGMRERLENVGGTLEIETQPAKGFRVNAWMPLSGGVI